MWVLCKCVVCVWCVCGGVSEVDDDDDDDDSNNSDDESEASDNSE